jgi:glycerophosphoryl diester phosphodiesterase
MIIGYAGQKVIRGISTVAGVAAMACAFAGCSRTDAGVHYTYDIRSKECCTLIAHAGGDIDGNPYTNSRQALLLSIRNGFHLIEMDFVQTREGDWFVTHDWRSWALHTGYQGTLPPTTQAVVALQDNFKVADAGIPVPNMRIPGTYSVLSLRELIDVLARHPKVKIITDTHSLKEAMDLIRALRGTSVFKQFVFQVYSMNELKQAAAVVPQQQLILTTYLMQDWYVPNGFDAAFLSQLEKYPHLFAFTMPMYSAAQRSKMKRLRSMLSIPILVHGDTKLINSHNLPSRLAEWGVNGIYVD